MKRRHFLEQTALAGIGLAHSTALSEEKSFQEKMLIDVHQHINYSGRMNDAFLKHQDAMGIAKTVLLPAGSITQGDSTHKGLSNGLAAKIFGTEAAARLAARHPKKFVYFANEVPDLPNATKAIETWLKKGACGIGEQKFNIAIDSPKMKRIYDLAKAYQVPVLIHIQHNRYNHGFERFHKVLEAYPSVNFIGHAQTWWGNIDKAHQQEELYPKTKVTQGGLTDRLLADYPNIYGDLSAGSGLNALTRDLEHAEGFLIRHQDKLVLGTDCNDEVDHGDTCSGSQAIAKIRELIPNKDTRSKLFSKNAQKIIRL